MNHAQCHGLKLDSQTREDARRRLQSIKGHVEGILRMLEDERVYCVDALKQIKAAPSTRSAAWFCAATSATMWSPLTRGAIPTRSSTN